MWWLDAILLVLLPVLAGLGGVFLGSWYIRRRLGDVEYGLAVLEDRLLREVKRRAAQAAVEARDERQDGQGATIPDSESIGRAIGEIRRLATGGDFQTGKEGGVFHGPR